MKKKDVVDLIIAHYDKDSYTFFQTASKILNEFRAQGAVELADMLESVLKNHTKVTQADAITYISEIAFKDVDWVDYLVAQNVTDDND